MHVMIGGLCAVLGVALGSFANVAIYRVPRGESVVSPPSACPHCGARVRPQHNVPVLSWLWLRGRCADCRGPISVRYPLVELSMGILFATVGVAVGVSWALPLLLVLAFFTVVLSMVDLETRRLPDRLLLPFAGFVAIGVTLIAIEEGEWNSLLRVVVGAAGVGAFYFIAFLVYPRGMGFGDVKMAPILGAALGSIGWSALVVGWFAAFFWGSLAGIATMLALRKRRGVAIPFGPWMFLGAWTGIVAGAPIAAWYLDVTGIT